MSLWKAERLGEKVSIEFSDDIQIDKLLGSLFADFQLSKSKQIEGVLLQVNKQAKSWMIIDTKSNDTREVHALGDLVYFLSDKIIYHLIDRINTGHCIHAACVAKEGRAFILPANSGSGKSSFTCWLVANGFDYISDELTIFLESGKVTAIPRPIQIKNHGIDAIKPLLKDHSKILEGRFANAISAKALGGQSSILDEWQLSGMIFPQYSKENSFSYEPMAGASVAMQLMGSHVNARNLDSHGFRFITKVARETPAFRLEYGGFNYLPDEFSATILGAALES